MQFKQNAGVLAANGQEVGHIDRVVVDPDSKAVTHIVVRKGFLFKEDKVVPIDLIADATEYQIRLREDAGDLHALPPFEEKHYVMSEEKTAQTNFSSGYAPSVMGPPPLVTSPADRYIAQIDQNIPEGTVALKEGAKVITAEGRHVGHVERVCTDPQADRATHLLISQGLFSKERKLVPITWVSIVGEDEVHLAVEPDMLENLSAYPN